MARLTTKERKEIPGSDSALPGKLSQCRGKGSYPIEDRVRAKNALARVAQLGAPAEKAEVMPKVYEKYPGIGEAKKKSGECGRGYRPEGRSRERER